MKRAIANSVVDPGSVRAQLRRILASAEFAGSERISRFLQLVVAETLAGRARDIKEYRIGVDVFDRPQSFNPATDPIVRVEARRLRTKLAKYYAEEGRRDEVVIDLPKGGYVPAFGHRDIAAPAAQAAPVRLAVMPFVDLTGSTDGAYLADGLTWELIHGLTRVKDLAVMAWNSSAQLRAERQPDIALIREKLRAQSILVGSVRRIGESLCVVAQLIDAESGVYLWSERYERRMEDAADIYRDISEAIVATLRIRLHGGDAPAPAAYNPEAYQLYLRGRGQWNQRTEAGLRGALDSFRAAADRDPNCAAAYAGIADCHALLAEYGFEPPSLMLAEAKSAALRAVQIDPSLGEAHCSLAFLAGIYEWNWTAAEAHYRRALELNPGHATAHHWFACDYLALSGRFDEAMPEIEIALALDPLSPIIAEGKAFLFVLQRDYDEAEAELDALRDANPLFYKASSGLGRVYLQQERFADAIDLLEYARSLAGDLPTILGALAQANGLAGHAERATELLHQLETMRRERYAPAASVALANLGLGRKDEAMRWLSEGLDAREANVALLNVHPAYDRLRDHPGFRELVKRLGLPDPKALASV